MESMKGVQVSVFFRRWYLDKLYSCAPDYPNGQLMNRFVRAICYFKYFLPPNTTIHPQSTCTTADELAAWMSNITRLANTVEANALKFVRDRKNAVADTVHATSSGDASTALNTVDSELNTVDSDATIAVPIAVQPAVAVEVQQPPKKKRKIEVYPTFESMYKYLNSANNFTLADFAALKPTNVIDLATKAAGIPAVRFDSVTQFRK